MASTRVLSVFAGLAAFLAAGAAFACRPLIGYQSFIPEPDASPGSSTLPAPEISVAQIGRGKAGSVINGEVVFASCDWMGWIYLNVPAADVGYRFEVVEGEFDADTFAPFPDEFVQPSGGFRRLRPGLIGFIWNDEPKSPQEPLDILVRITSITADGVQSEPQWLRVQHSGEP